MDIRNSYLLKQLADHIGKDVLLFGIDSMSYFGKLRRITSGSAILEPASVASSELVEILNPAEISAVENISRVDLDRIIAVGYDISADPFVIPDTDAEDVTTDETRSQVQSTYHPFYEQEECMLFEDEEQMGLITISTLGGFLFAGEILHTCHCVAELNAQYIFAPGGDGSTLFSVGKVAVNLKAKTAISS